VGDFFVVDSGSCPRDLIICHHAPSAKALVYVRDVTAGVVSRGARAVVTGDAVGGARAPQMQIGESRGRFGGYLGTRS
jgi:hypothetical protein